MKLDVRKFQLFNLLVALLLSYSYFSWSRIGASVLMYFLMLAVGINMGLHRGFSHGRLEPDSFFGRICLFFSVLTCMGRPSSWILVHRLHHIYSDTNLDPHSPTKSGRWQVFTNTWSLSKEIPANAILAIKTSIRKSSAILFFDRNYWTIIGLYCGALLIFGGVGMLVYAWCIPATGALLATSLVNAFCHDPKGNILNVKWISLMTFGEGFHKYHHLNPNSNRTNQSAVLDFSGWLLTRFLKGPI